MVKKSIFRRYFSVFTLSVILSMLVLGVVLLVFAAQYFRQEKYAVLERNASRAAQITAASYEASRYGLIDKTVIAIAYSVFSSAENANIFLVDLSGKTLHFAGENSDRYYGFPIPEDAIAASLQGRYEETGFFGGMYEVPYYTVGVPVLVNSSPVGVLFASAPADGLNRFLQELGEMFLFSALVVLIIASMLIYVVTSRLVRPLKDMLAATQSFSQGDFSKRVPVSGYDEIGQLAMAFNNMASSLAITESARRSFVANVSHELKTPMTTISGFIDGILDGTVPEERREQYLQVVSNEVKRLSRLVRSMLDTARIEAGEMEIIPVLFDISETIRQIIFGFERMIEEKRLEIRGLEVDKVMVYADRDLMYQVAYNLIENAVKFVNEDGYIQFSYHSDNQRTYVAIRNSGEGIEKTEVPQLFERFYKSDKSRSLNKYGAGLGLHIVKSIVNYHRGEVVVRSVEKEYTEFEFCIPNPPKGV